MKTSFYKICALLVGALCFTSCDKFLEEDPRGQLLTNSAFTQPGDLEGSVNVLYRQVSRSTFGMTQFIQAFMGDDLSTHPASNKASMREFDNYSVSSGNDRLLWCWQDKWLVIKAANFIINGAENTPDVSKEEIDYALNQAHFWRAWAYFSLVRMFGPLPMVLTTDVDFSMGLSKVSEVFDLIVSDLQAAEHLPVRYNSAPKSQNGIDVVVNQAAAKAMLSYVYLTMAGWPLNLGSEYYTLAANKAKEVIDGVEGGTYKYALYDEYSKIHSRQENRTNKECILGIYYTNALGTGDSSESARGGILDIPDCAGAYNDTRAEIGFYCSFPEGPRKDATYPSVTYVTSRNEAFPWWSNDVPENCRFPYFGKTAYTSGSGEYDFTMKYDDQANGWQDQTRQLIRLSEVYCWYAEALGRSGQTNAKAVELLNKVRNRADGNGVVSDPAINRYDANISAAQLADAAYDEHGWEIAGWWASVATRYNDMQRMDRVKTAFETRKQRPEYVIPGSGGVVLQEPNGPVDSWSQAKMYVPYPMQDAERNAALNITLEEKLNLIK